MNDLLHVCWCAAMVVVPVGLFFFGVFLSRK